MAPCLINFANAAINAIINGSLLKYGGDNAIAAIVAFNRYVTIFVFIVIGICQGMQPILGYNYGSGRFKRLFKTITLAAICSVTVTALGSTIGQIFPTEIARLFMQDPAQIAAATNCLKITTLVFWLVGFQIVVTNFFQSIGKAGKAIFLSLTRQILFMIPLIMILPQYMGLDGVWTAFPVSDAVSTLVAIALLWWQIRRINRLPQPATESR